MICCLEFMHHQKTSTFSNWLRMTQLIFSEITALQQRLGDIHPSKN